MIWISITFLVICLLSIAGWFIFRQDHSSDGQNCAIWAVVAAGASGLIAVILFIVSSVVVIKAGNVGVQVVFGNVKPTYLDGGLHFVNPFSSVEQISVRTENYLMSSKHDEGQKKGDDSVSVTSSNGLTMSVDISIPYRLAPSSVPWVYQNLGTDYVEKLLRPALQTAARRAASKFTAEECYSTKRDDLAEKIRQHTSEELNKILHDGYQGQGPPEQVLVFSQVLIGHVGIPETVKQSIEAKLRADQEQQAMDFRLLREQKEAERKKIEAKGIQEFQVIVSKGIDQNTLRWRAIDATLKLSTSPNAKIVIIGNPKDGLPVIMGGWANESAKK